MWSSLSCRSLSVSLRCHSRSASLVQGAVQHCHGSSGVLHPDPRAVALAEQSFVSIPKAIAPEDAHECLELLWDEYSRKHGVSRLDPKGWATRGGKSKHLYGSSPERLASSAKFVGIRHKVQSLAEDMFGKGRWAIRDRTTIFVNCPHPSGKWAVPAGFHTDQDLKPGETEPHFLYAFVFLDVLSPRGGATVLLEGSGMQMQRLANARPCDSLPWRQGNAFFPDIFGECEGASTQDMLRAGHIPGCPQMNVVEMLGAKGDVMFWDPRVVHSSSGNASDRPRSVVRFRLDRKCHEEEGGEVWKAVHARMSKASALQLSDALLCSLRVQEQKASTDCRQSTCHTLTFR